MTFILQENAKQQILFLNMANPFPTSTRVLEFFYSIDIEYIFGSCKKRGRRETLCTYAKAHILPTLHKPSIRHSIIIAESYIQYLSQSLQEPESLVQFHSCKAGSVRLYISVVSVENYRETQAYICFATLFSWATPTRRFMWGFPTNKCQINVIYFCTFLLVSWDLETSQFHSYFSTPPLRYY